MPNTREKLIELLQDSVYENVELDDGYVGYEVNYDNIANHLIAHGVTVQEWISVKDIDRLPTENKRVLVYGYRSGEIFKARRRGNKWYSSWDNVTEIECVSHWAHLPQPPKGE